VTAPARRNLRAAVILPLLMVVFAALVWAFAGVPDFGDYHGVYGTVLNHAAVAQRHAGNVVAAVVFDYRGLDTLGEEFILFAAASGVVLLLRSPEAAAAARRRDRVRHDSTRVVGTLMIPVVLVLGLWTAAFGYVTPGGGFQGGVVVAGAVLLVWIAAGYDDFRRLAPVAVVDASEAFGVGSYVAIGLVGLGVGGAFLANVVPLGTVDTLTSSGTIALLNWATAFEVAGANVLIYRAFLEHHAATLTPDD
jgi:multicomponent Na+:H+ antiporter subunit B